MLLYMMVKKYWAGVLLNNKWPFTISDRPVLASILVFGWECAYDTGSLRIFGGGNYSRDTAGNEVSHIDTCL